MIVTKMMTSTENNDHYGMNNNENNTANDTDDRIVSIIRIIMIRVMTDTIIIIRIIIRMIMIDIIPSSVSFLVLFSLLFIPN